MSDSQTDASTRVVPSPPKGHILIVDDVRVNRLLLSRFLGEQGYRVDTASDGHQALSAVAGELPDSQNCCGIARRRWSGHQVLYRCTFGPASGTSRTGWWPKRWTMSGRRAWLSRSDSRCRRVAGWRRCLRSLCLPGPGSASFRPGCCAGRDGWMRSISSCRTPSKCWRQHPRRFLLLSIAATTWPKGPPLAASGTAYSRWATCARRYRDLYFAGGSTHPGNGLPLGLRSARLTTERIPRELGAPQMP